MTTASPMLAFLDLGEDPSQEICHANWLGSPYEAPVWKVGAHHIRWDRSLPNNLKLTDTRYARLLATSKRVFFNSRGSPLITPVGEETHLNVANGLFGLIDWVVYQQDLFHPDRQAFTLLDRASIKGLITQFVNGGMDSIKFVIPRLHEYFKTNCLDANSILAIESHRAEIPPEIFTRNRTDRVQYSFRDDEIDLIRSWLYLCGFYERGRKYVQVGTTMDGYLNRRKICRLLGQYRSTTSPAVSLFLRQFEYVSSYPAVEQTYLYWNRELPPVDHECIEVLAERKKSLTAIYPIERVLNNFLLLAPYVDGLPNIDELTNLNVRQLASDAGAVPSKHTKTIPTPIALHILNKAIGYIHSYGEPLVDFFSRWADTYAQLRLSHDAPSQNDILDLKHRAFDVTQQPAALVPLNIGRLLTWWRVSLPRNEFGGHAAAAKCRSCASLEDAISILITSVFVVVAIMSARRRGELVELRLDCLSGTMHNYEITFELEKLLIEGTRPTISRPIPDIAAKGIELLGKLTRQWMDVVGDKSNTSLFYFPCDLQTGQRLSYSDIQHQLDRFSDFMEIPVDRDGRRWYVTPHEFRRFFAIVFFWQYRFASLTALQWMLGHSRPEKTYRYIRSIVGAREMTRQEARYTREVMLEESHQPAIDELRRWAADYFQTKDIALIAEEDMVTYLAGLIDTGVFKVRPHGIKTDEGTVHEMVFEIHKLEV